MEKQSLKGNEAVSEAAMPRGCRFFSGYPITSRNEIPEYVSHEDMPAVGVFFLPRGGTTNCSAAVSVGEIGDPCVAVRGRSPRHEPASPGGVPRLRPGESSCSTAPFAGGRGSGPSGPFFSRGRGSPDPVQGPENSSREWAASSSRSHVFSSSPPP